MATTTVDIVIRLQVPGTSEEVEAYRDALQNLAEVMVVQAEDGLWTQGYADAEEPNDALCDIEKAYVQTILIEGLAK